jgi:hypothetical protein
VSETDSFIDEVTEEVRRDRLYRYVKRYGWIAVLAVVLLVGAAGWNEWRKAQDRAAARDLGDAILAALEAPDSAARAEALADVAAPSDGGQAVLTLLTAAEARENDPAAAAQRLLSLADSADAPQIYRQLATLKAVTIRDGGLGTQERRQRMESLTRTGGLLRLLAAEQLALVEIEAGETGAAVARLQRIVEDAEATATLKRRARQLLVALGEEPAA